jgi:hypothetical protein
MSRSGYTEECYSEWDLIRWRGAVRSAIRGRRGQAFLLEMLWSLDEMPARRLIEGALMEGGEICALGAVAAHRGTDVSGVDPEDRETVAATFGIALAMAAEIMYENDKLSGETPEQRWYRMRRWVEAKIVE